MKKKIEKMEGLNDNQIIVIEEREDGGKHFDLFSYRTLIASYDTSKMDDITITDAWDYSRTTARALYEFLQCYTFISYRTKGGYVNELFSDLMNSKNKKELVNYLINSGQVKKIHVEIEQKKEW